MAGGFALRWANLATEGERPDHHEASVSTGIRHTILGNAVLAGDDSMYSGQHRPLLCKFSCIRQGIVDVGLMSPRYFLLTR